MSQLQKWMTRRKKTHPKNASQLKKLVLSKEIPKTLFRKVCHIRKLGIVGKISHS